MGGKTGGSYPPWPVDQNPNRIMPDQQYNQAPIIQLPQMSAGNFQMQSLNIPQPKFPGNQTHTPQANPKSQSEGLGLTVSLPQAVSLLTRDDDED